MTVRRPSVQPSRAALLLAAVAGAMLPAAPALAATATATGPAAVHPAALVRGGTLGRMAAVSSRDAWSVGTSAAGNAMILHWDGSAWRSQHVARPGSSSDLFAVAATSARDAWAVGTVGGAASLTEHWDGSAWRRVASPAGLFFGVAARTPRDAWEVGQTFAGHALAAHWDGTRWQPMAVPGGTPSSLSGVAIVSARNVWAVGQRGSIPLIVHWDGRRWHKATGALLDNSSLNDVIAFSARNAWAVGETGIAGATFIEHWDGARWRRVASPSPGHMAGLTAVGGSSPSDIWAVGNFAAHGGTSEILHWDGSHWTLVSAPRPQRTGNTLLGVVATGPGQAWASGVTGSNKAVILSWNGSAWR